MRKSLSLIFGVLTILGGVYCLFAPEFTFLTLGYVVGISIIFNGLGRIISWFQIHKEANVSGWMLASAILSLIFGFMLVGSEVLKMAVNAIAIAWMIVIGVIRIVQAMWMKKVQDVTKGYGEDAEIGKHWWVVLIMGILLTVSGVIGLLLPSIAARMIRLLLGMGILVSGVNMICFGAFSCISV